MRYFLNKRIYSRRFNSDELPWFFRSSWWYISVVRSCHIIVLLQEYYSVCRVLCVNCGWQESNLSISFSPVSTIISINSQVSGIHSGKRKPAPFFRTCSKRDRQADAICLDSQLKHVGELCKEITLLRFIWGDQWDLFNDWPFSRDNFCQPLLYKVKG
jgi:hypothetical protein